MLIVSEGRGRGGRGGGSGGGGSDGDGGVCVLSWSLIVAEET